MDVLVTGVLVTVQEVCSMWASAVLGQEGRELQGPACRP
jgi:hypothetical protein